jgi:hypothetical protein
MTAWHLIVALLTRSVGQNEFRRIGDANHKHVTADDRHWQFGATTCSTFAEFARTCSVAFAAARTNGLL